MTSLSPGTWVRHPEFGTGEIVRILGRQAIVRFFGEELNVDAGELSRAEPFVPEVLDHAASRNRVLFRRCHEAINLGVVPPHPDELLAMTIDGERVAAAAQDWLNEAPVKGLCKVVFGDYGQGKSHRLKVVEACALRQGWVVSYVEFDPKQADPAKPHLVYGAVVTGLRFPAREDGSQAHDFFDLVGEMRLRFGELTEAQYFQRSEWFRPALRALRFKPHSRDDDLYVAAVEWLAGQAVPHNTVAALCRSAGQRVEQPCKMPKSLECADIYVFHLVVINEVCRKLGYKGLLILLDEAEHVRGFSVNRANRANNLFDLLARSSHKRLRDGTRPIGNEHGMAVPEYWNEGPHFGLVVALTEGSTFGDPNVALRDACVFLHSKADVVRLGPPTVRDYGDWCRRYFSQFSEHYPESAGPLVEAEQREYIAQLLESEYARQPLTDRNIRLWGKMAAFVCSLSMARRADDMASVEQTVRNTARQASGEILPWEL